MEKLRRPDLAKWVPEAASASAMKQNAPAER